MRPGLRPVAAASRRAVLLAHGAGDAAVEELLGYGANHLLDGEIPPLPPLPLADEPHLEAWRAYAEAARSEGVWPALSRRLVQLRLPIQEGISRTPEYRAATRRGEPPAGAPGLALAAPEALELHLHPSLGGTVPTLLPAVRADFVALVRALSGRNEPIPVPDSMGACMVSGLVNWDRVRAHRERWLATTAGPTDASAWAREMALLTQRRELYQDRLVILSHGPYSNVAAADVGLAEGDWLAASLRIRREHECAHYFALRLFGRLQHNLLEELVADLVGLVAGCGTYRADLARLFLGIERPLAYRGGGRLENYRGRPPLSDEAFTVLARVAGAGTATLDRVTRAHPEWCSSPLALAPLVAALTTLTMEELAAPTALETIEERVATLFG